MKKKSPRTRRDDPDGDGDSMACGTESTETKLGRRSDGEIRTTLHRKDSFDCAVGICPFREGKKMRGGHLWGAHEREEERISISALVAFPLEFLSSCWGKTDSDSERNLRFYSG